MTDRYAPCPTCPVTIDITEHAVQLDEKYPGQYDKKGAAPPKSRNSKSKNVDEKRESRPKSRFNPMIDDVALGKYDNRPFSKYSVDNTSFGLRHQPGSQRHANKSSITRDRSGSPRLARDRSESPRLTRDKLHSSDRVKGTTGWSKLDNAADNINSTLSRKSILRHSFDSLGSLYKKTAPHNSTSSRSSSSSSVGKRVRFHDQVKRRVVPSAELVDLVRSDSESSLNTDSSGNLCSVSDLSLTSGTGSLQELGLVDYSLTTSAGDDLGLVDYSVNASSSYGVESELNSEKKASVKSEDNPNFQSPFTRLSRQYSSNDSDYSTENESLYGLDQLKKNEPRYSSSDSFKSSAYSSSSSTKSFSYSKSRSETIRPRVISESSEDEPHQEVKIQKIKVNEIHNESDEELHSGSSNSTLAESSSSDSDIVLPSGIIIKREKFTSGSEFESSCESDSGVKSASWMMTVMEHRASSPGGSSPRASSPRVKEKEIDFKFKVKNQNVKEFSESSCQSEYATPENTVLNSEFIDHSFVGIPDIKLETVISENSANPSQHISEKVDISVGTDDISDNTLSLTMVTSLDGSLTQTSLFNIASRSKIDPDLYKMKSFETYSSGTTDTTTSSDGIHAPYDLVKQIVKRNEMLKQFAAQQANDPKLTEYSDTSLSSLDSDFSSPGYDQFSQPCLEAFYQQLPHHLYDKSGKKKLILVSTGTSPETSGLNAPVDCNKSTENIYMSGEKVDEMKSSSSQTDLDIAAFEVMFKDYEPTNKNNFVDIDCQTSLKELDCLSNHDTLASFSSEYDSDSDITSCTYSSDYSSCMSTSGSQRANGAVSSKPVYLLPSFDVSSGQQTLMISIGTSPEYAIPSKMQNDNDHNEMNDQAKDTQKALEDGGECGDAISALEAHYKRIYPGGRMDCKVRNVTCQTAPFNRCPPNVSDHLNIVRFSDVDEILPSEEFDLQSVSFNNLSDLDKCEVSDKQKKMVAISIGTSHAGVKHFDDDDDASGSDHDHNRCLNTSSSSENEVAALDMKILEKSKYHENTKARKKYENTHCQTAVDTKISENSSKLDSNRISVGKSSSSLETSISSTNSDKIHKVLYETLPTEMLTTLGKKKVLVVSIGTLTTRSLTKSYLKDDDKRDRVSLQGHYPVRPLHSFNKSPTDDLAKHADNEDLRPLEYWKISAPELQLMDRKHSTLKKVTKDVYCQTSFYDPSSSTITSDKAPRLPTDKCTEEIGKNVLNKHKPLSDDIGLISKSADDSSSGIPEIKMETLSSENSANLFQRNPDNLDSSVGTFDKPLSLRQASTTSSSNSGDIISSMKNSESITSHNLPSKELKSPTTPTRIGKSKKEPKLPPDIGTQGIGKNILEKPLSDNVGLISKSADDSSSGIPELKMETSSSENSANLFQRNPDNVDSSVGTFDKSLSLKLASTTSSSNSGDIISSLKGSESNTPHKPPPKEFKYQTTPTKIVKHKQVPKEIDENILEKPLSDNIGLISKSVDDSSLGIDILEIKMETLSSENSSNLFQRNPDNMDSSVSTFDKPLSLRQASATSNSNSGKLTSSVNSSEPNTSLNLPSKEMRSHTTPSKIAKSEKSPKLPTGIGKEEIGKNILEKPLSDDIGLISKSADDSSSGILEIKMETSSSANSANLFQRNPDNVDLSAGTFDKPLNLQLASTTSSSNRGELTSSPKSSESITNISHKLPPKELKSPTTPTRIIKNKKMFMISIGTSTADKYFAKSITGNGSSSYLSDTSLSDSTSSGIAALEVHFKNFTCDERKMSNNYSQTSDEEQLLPDNNLCSPESPCELSTKISDSDTDKYLRVIPKRAFAYQKPVLPANSQVCAQNVASGYFVREKSENSESSASDSVSFHEVQSEDVDSDDTFSSSDQDSDLDSGSSPKSQIVKCDVHTDSSISSKSSDNGRNDGAAGYASDSSSEETSASRHEKSEPTTSSMHSADQRLCEAVFNEVENMIKSASSKADTFESDQYSSEKEVISDRIKRQAMENLGIVNKEMADSSSSSSCTVNDSSQNSSFSKMHSLSDLAIIKAVNDSSKASKQTSTNTKATMEDINNYLRYLSDDSIRSNSSATTDSAGNTHGSSEVVDTGEAVAGSSVEHSIESQGSPNVEAIVSSFERMHALSSPLNRTVNSQCSSTNSSTLNQVSSINSGSTSSSNSTNISGVPKLSKLSTRSKPSVRDTTSSDEELQHKIRSCTVRRKITAKVKNGDTGDGSSSENGMQYKKSSRSSAYSSRLKSSSRQPGRLSDMSSHKTDSIVAYDMSSETDGSTTAYNSAQQSDEDMHLEEGDLLYSIKLNPVYNSSLNSDDKSGEHRALNQSDKLKTYGTDSASFNVDADEITDDHDVSLSKDRTFRWQDDYSVLRAVKWICCPCADS